MNVDELLLPLALILVVAKLFSILGKKLGLPQVVGMIVAGILLGLIRYIPGQNVFTSSAMEGLSFLAKIGVILIMFSAGLDTDLKQFKKIGVPSVVITMLGVAFPLLFGILTATVSPPAVTMSGMRSERGSTTVSAPGMKCAARVKKTSGMSRAMSLTSSTREMCTMRGLSCGLPFASKIFFTAAAS